METPQVLVIDDDPLIIKLVERVLLSQGIPGKLAGSIGEGKAALAENPELSVLLCDHLLPDGLGVDFLKEIRSTYPNLVRVLMTGMYDKNLALQAINSGEIYRFLVKPFSIDDLLITINQSLDRYRLAIENLRLHERLEQQNQALKHANAELSKLLNEEELKARGFQLQTSSWKLASQGMIDLCVEIIQRTDPLLQKHSQRVMNLAASIAKMMLYDSEFIEKLSIAAQFHDLGLLGCNTTLRGNQRRPDLVQDFMDREQLKLHPHTSAQLVKFLPLPDVIEAIQQHHEYLDGSGYPEGLREDRLSTMSQILGVADYYTEYGNSATVIQHMQTTSGALFNSDMVRALERVISSGQHVPREKSVMLQELLPGMKLSGSIYTASGMLLVKQGQILTMPIIQRLQQHSQSHAITQNILIES
jgi:response regulator RpfG family c-di-GMP phosphodiesterase